MAGRVGMGREEHIDVAVAPMLDADERGMSHLIGGLMLFGLAWGGLAIGYASAAMQWLATSLLVTPGLALTASGVWNLIKNNLR